MYILSRVKVNCVKVLKKSTIRSFFENLRTLLRKWIVCKNYSLDDWKNRKCYWEVFNIWLWMMYLFVYIRSMMMIIILDLQWMDVQPFSNNLIQIESLDQIVSNELDTVLLTAWHQKYLTPTDHNVTGFKKWSCMSAIVIVTI